MGKINKEVSPLDRKSNLIANTDPFLREVLGYDALILLKLLKGPTYAHINLFLLLGVDKFETHGPNRDELIALGVCELALIVWWAEQLPWRQVCLHIVLFHKLKSLSVI